MTSVARALEALTFPLGSSEYSLLRHPLLEPTATLREGQVTWSSHMVVLRLTVPAELPGDSHVRIHLGHLAQSRLQITARAGANPSQLPAEPR